MGIRSLIRDMLETQPEERPSVKAILNGEFLQSFMQEDFLSEYPHHEEVKAMVDLFQYQKKYAIKYAPKRYDPEKGRNMDHWQLSKERSEIEEEWRQSEQRAMETGGTGGSEGLEVMRRMEREFREKFRKGRSNFKDPQSIGRSGYQSNYNQKYPPSRY